VLHSIAQEFFWRNLPGSFAVFAIWMVPVAILAWKAGLVITHSDRKALLIACAVPAFLTLLLVLWLLWELWTFGERARAT
jgi:hypothetical protein